MSGDIPGRKSQRLTRFRQGGEGGGKGSFRRSKSCKVQKPFFFSFLLLFLLQGFLPLSRRIERADEFSVRSEKKGPSLSANTPGRRENGKKRGKIGIFFLLPLFCLPRSHPLTPRSLLCFSERPSLSSYFHPLEHICPFPGNAFILPPFFSVPRVHIFFLSLLAASALVESFLRAGIRVFAQVQQFFSPPSFPLKNIPRKKGLCLPWLRSMMICIAISSSDRKHHSTLAFFCYAFTSLSLSVCLQTSGE